MDLLKHATSKKISALLVATVFLVILSGMVQTMSITRSTSGIGDTRWRDTAVLNSHSAYQTLEEMGLSPISLPGVETDPWKADLFARLDRIRISCGELCNRNDVQTIQKHTVNVGAALPMVVVPDVNCLAILGEEEIDASDNSTPAIPKELQSYFTISDSYPIVTSGNYSKRMKKSYLGGVAAQRVWKEHIIEQMVLEAAKGTLRGTYGINGTRYLNDVLSRIDMKRKSVLVIGSEKPWVEALVLHHGASKVTTLEYGKIISKHPKIETITPSEFRKKFLAGEMEEFDGVVSHSSIEHSGLGRYGDALNPWGDILAVARAWCATKEGGFLYLGVPTGKDMIVSNWHRVYGRIRWPLLATNWRNVDSVDLQYLVDRSDMSWANGGIGFVFQKYTPAR